MLHYEKTNEVSPYYFDPIDLLPCISINLTVVSYEPVRK